MTAVHDDDDGTNAAALRRSARRDGRPLGVLRASGDRHGRAGRHGCDRADRHEWPPGVKILESHEVGFSSGAGSSRARAADLLP